MAPQKINVKERLSEGEIDLSMSDLQDVPVKDIAVFKKAYSLDLSNNHLKALPVSFASALSHLTKLDLSKNQLTELPDNFGELTKLKHLDLYHNKLQHLPLSFANLKALKWLDLKDNPLVPAVAKVAGPCLDSKQCQTCAKDVVTFFSQVQEQVSNDLEIRQKQRQKQLEANQQKQMDNKKNKKKEKVKPKKENGPVKDTVPKPAPTKKNKKSLPSEKQAKKASSVCSLIKNLVVLSFLGLFILTSVKYKHTRNVEEAVVRLYGRGLSSLPPNVQVYAEKAGSCVRFTHEKIGNVTLELVNYLRNTENFVNTYDALGAQIEGLLQTIKEQYKKYVS